MFQITNNLRLGKYKLACLKYPKIQNYLKEILIIKNRMQLLDK